MAGYYVIGITMMVFILVSHWVIHTYLYKIREQLYDIKKHFGVYDKDIKTKE